MSIERRRGFLRRSATAAAAASALVHSSVEARVREVRKLRLGAIGCGGQGTSLLKTFAQMPDVELAYVCDPDDARGAKAAEAVKGHAEPKVVRDLRTILDDASIDAVTVATPDHWHGPATLLALAAGKHVYVEKPCSHNLREGRLMVEAAAAAGRVVQVGTQARSTAFIAQVFDKLRQGAIGEVLAAKAWNSQRRKDIGRMQPSEAPAGFDYDLWVGPAPMVPFQANRHHYTWHWWYDFGTGDGGNDGVHEIDVARWGLGVDTHPARITALGGKLGFDDDQQFPDTQYAVFQWDTAGGAAAKQLIFEMRIWSPYRQEGYENGCAFYGRDGMLLLGKGEGYKLFGPKNTLIEEKSGTVDTQAHRRNFIDCVLSGAKPNADITVGHLSASLCHLANIATRTGRTLRFDGSHEQVVADDEANALIRRTYRDGHWAVPKGV